MADPALHARLHRNVMAVSALNGEAPDGIADWRDGELLYSASRSAPFLNGVFRDGPGRDPAALLDRAEAFYADRGAGFLVYVAPDDDALDDAALAAGLAVVLPHYPEMVCRAPLPVLAGDVRPVADRDAAAAYWRICDAAYQSVGVPPGTFTATLAPEMLLRDGVEACVVWAGGRPAACASIWMAEGIGMVGWVGALPDARGQGLAAAATVWATNRAFALGADVAALQASAMGEPLYERLGYEHAYAYRILGSMSS
jgi:GNAT superfamily N-acetyltransferase